MGRNEPVQRIVGIGGVILGLPGTVAAHILTKNIAVGIILVGVLLGLGWLLPGVHAIHSQQTAHVIIGIILHPAVGVVHLRHAGHAVVGIGGDAVPSVGDDMPQSMVA